MRFNCKAVPIINLFFELVIAIPYPYLTSFVTGYNILKYLKVIMLAYEILLLLVSIKEDRISLKSMFNCCNVFLILYVIYQWCITVINQSLPLQGSLSFPFSVLLLVLSINRAFQRKTEIVLKAVLSYFYIAIALNFLTIIFFADGLYTEYSTSGNFHVCYLLGVDNQFGSIIFPGLAIIWFSEFLLGYKKPWISLSALGITMCTYIIAGSVAGTVAFMFLLILYILFNIKAIRRFFTLKLFAVIIGAATFLIVGGADLIYNSPYLKGIIEVVAGKDMTFSGRTYIWQIGLNNFANNPVFGYGKSSGDVAVVFNGREFSAHNAVLQILLEGGIIGLFLFGTFIFNADMRNSSVIGVHDEIRILYIGFFTTFVYFLMESGDLLPLIVLLLILSCYSKKLQINCGAFPIRKKKINQRY